MKNDEQRVLKRVVVMLIIVIILLILIDILYIKIKTKEMDKGVEDLVRVEGIRGGKETTEDEREYEKIALEDTIPDYSREKEPEKEKFKGDEAGSSPEVERDETPRYEVGDIIEEIGVIEVPEIELEDEEESKYPSDENNFYRDINFYREDRVELRGSDIDNGKPKILYVWSSMVDESVEGLKEYNKVDGSEVDIIFINRGFGNTETLEVIREKRKEYTDKQVYMDKEYQFQAAKMVEGVYPTTFYLNGNFDLYKKVLGKQTKQEIESMIKEIPEEMDYRKKESEGR